MKTKNLTLVAGLMLALVSGSAFGQTTIISDTYTVTGSGTGFGVTKGVNTGINPPTTTRLTGVAASGLRYMATVANSRTNSCTILTNRLSVAAGDANSTRFVLSADGITPFDFGSALGIASASPTNPAVYDIKVKIKNNVSGAQRCSFALGTTEGDNSTWDFGLQVYRVATANNFYTLADRIDAGSGTGTDITGPIYTNAAGSYGTELSVLIRVTDAGAESGANYNSKLQVSLDGGTSWIYSTTNDAALPNGWRLDGANRFIMWDIAGTGATITGYATYDDFSITSVTMPAGNPTRTWTGGGADDNWSSAANWGGTAPNSLDALVFDGTTRQANVNDIGGLIAAAVTFNNGGFNLSGGFSIRNAITNLAGINTFSGDLAWDQVFAKKWSIASGSEVVLNNNNSVEVTGDHTISGGGTLRLKGGMDIGQSTTANPAFIINEGQHIIDGGIFRSRGGYRIGSLSTSSGAQTIVTNGGTLNLTLAGSTLRVGDSANPVTTQLLIDNSTVSLGNGNLSIPFATGATSQVSQVGGLVSGAIVNFNHAGAGVGTYTIKNGTLEALLIKKTTAGGNSTINFDNAILRTAPGASNAFFSGVNVAEIQAGGLALDVTTDIAIAQILSGTGTLTKTNSGTVTLTGTNTYTGNTVIQSSKLVLSTIQSNATTVQVGDSAELGVLVTTPGTTLSVPALQFNGASFGTLSFDLGSFTTPTAPLMRASSLSVSGPVTVNIANGLQLTTGQIVLVDYDGSISGGFQFSLGSLPPGVTATLVNNTANSSIDLNITGVPGYTWTGATDNNWDFTTPNWISQQTGAASTYTDGVPALFNDNAITGLVNLTTLPTPNIIVVSNNSLPYVWTSAGGALTVNSLKKYGTNLLRRVTSDADLVAGIELNQGSYAISNTTATSFTTVLTDVGVGTGTFVKEGINILVMTSTNSSYDGAILVKEGTLKLSNTNSLGTTNGTTTIASGATLDVNDIISPHEPVFVSGVGVDGLGAIIDSTTGGAVAHNLTDVTMTGDTTFGTPNGGRWDIRVRSSSGPGPGLRGNGYNLRKVGSGNVSIACQRSLNAATPYWQMNLGDVLVEGGTLAFAESLSLGNPAKTITLQPGTTMQLFDLALTNPIVRNIFMTDARITCGGTDTDTNVIDGSITLTGANSFKPDLAILIINGPIVGSGSLAISANDPGRVYLNGVNTYPGDTIVTNGVLGGTGSIAGNLIMLGGTNAPGMGIGTLTVNGNVALGGMTLMELNRSLSPNSDRLVVGGILTNGGTLKVVLGTGAPSPQAGDVYQLFNKGSVGTFTTISLPNISALPGGLSWNTTNLSVNGTISVDGTVTSPTITGSSVSGGNFIMNGTGGIQGNSYTVLSSTNVALPIANWTAVVTNVFGSGGTFGFTNSLDPNAPATFYLLQVQ